MRRPIFGKWNTLTSQPDSYKADSSFPMIKEDTEAIILCDANDVEITEEVVYCNVKDGLVVFWEKEPKEITEVKNNRIFRKPNPEADKPKQDMLGITPVLLLKARWYFAPLRLYVETIQGG